MITEIEVSDISPSPYQHRRSFPSGPLRDLAKSIERDGLVQPIVVRPKNPGWELIAGERRWRAVRDYGSIQTLLARIVDVPDLQARRMCAAENVQRQDLSDVEAVEALVEVIDAELGDEPDYLALGDCPKVRVKKLLTNLNNAVAGNSKEALALKGKFALKVEEIFAGLPRPVDWESFYRHDLRLVTNLDEDVRDVAIANKLNKSQTKALNELKREDPTAYQNLTANRDEDNVVTLPFSIQEEPGEMLADLPAKGMKPVPKPEPPNPHVANNSGENEWYTPAKYIHKAREVMGGIDCDPASSVIANETVQATTFFTLADDGLKQRWSGRVWMNPPYAQPLIEHFTRAMSEKFQSGEIEQAVVLVNNATETDWFQGLAKHAAAVCFPRHRIRFVDPSGAESGAPLQGQAILYLGDRAVRFREVFQDEGITLTNV